MINEEIENEILQFLSKRVSIVAVEPFDIFDYLKNKFNINSKISSNILLQ